MTIDVVPRDLYYHEVDYVRDLESTLERVRAFCQKQADMNLPDAALWAQAVDRCWLEEERKANSQFGVGA